MVLAEAAVTSPGRRDGRRRRRSGCSRRLVTNTRRLLANDAAEDTADVIGAAGGCRRGRCAGYRGARWRCRRRWRRAEVAHGVTQVLFAGGAITQVSDAVDERTGQVVARFEVHLESCAEEGVGAATLADDTDQRL